MKMLLMVLHGNERIKNPSTQQSFSLGRIVHESSDADSIWERIKIIPQKNCLMRKA